eukprot:scaffold224483_cov26-Tisochrysis_lutea.AAC.4
MHPTRKPGALHVANAQLRPLPCLHDGDDRVARLCHQRFLTLLCAPTIARLKGQHRNQSQCAPRREQRDSRKGVEGKGGEKLWRNHQ